MRQKNVHRITTSNSPTVLFSSSLYNALPSWNLDVKQNEMGFRLEKNLLHEMDSDPW